MPQGAGVFLASFLVSLTSLSGATSKVKAMVCVSRLVLSVSLLPHGLGSSDSSFMEFSRGKNIGVCCHSQHQGIFLTRCGQILCRQTTITVVQLPNIV